MSLYKLQEIISSSISKKEVCIKIGYKTGTKYNEIVDEIGKKYNIDITHLSNKYIQNLLNRHIGKLTVKNFLGSNGKVNLWNCQCECGNYIQASTAQLNSKTIHQCSKCSRKENGKSHIKDLTNQRFGKLTVLSINEKITEEKHKCGDTHTYWNCICDCGKQYVCSSNNLKNGTIISCGCLRSSGEFLVEQALLELHKEYKKEYIFKDLKGDNSYLRFDFAIFKNNILQMLIECQGQEHFAPVNFWGGEEKFNQRTKYDKLKKDYCFKNNIPLLYISYKDYPKINKEYLSQLMEDII